MNENVKVVLGFLAGAVLSGVGTYIFTDKKLSREFELALDEYKAEMEGKNKDDNEAADTDGDDETEQDSESDKRIDIPQDALDAAKVMREGIRRAKDKKTIKNYGNVERDIRRDLRDIDEEGGDNMYEESLKMVKNKPVIVAFDEYNENSLGYRQVELYFDDHDYKIFNDDGEEVEDMGITVGYENMDELSHSDEPDIYIRNDNLKEYYMVTKEYRW